MDIGRPERREALDRRFKKEMKRKKIPLDEYTALPPFEWRGQPHDGLMIYDLAEGNGKAPAKGATVVVRASVFL